ncbi:hypothetical protein FP804_01135 [archaeon]|nr:hypothetical protein [archaeon]
MTTNENFKELLKFIDERLQKKHNPELELVRKHNAEAMNKDWKIPEDGLWEQSDVIHDFLAFLAEQMIEMNKEKQKAFALLLLLLIHLNHLLCKKCKKIVDDIGLFP